MSTTEKIREAVRASDLTVTVIAHRAEVDRRVVLDLLAGRRLPRFATVEKIAHAIGLKIELVSSSEGERYEEGRAAGGSLCAGHALYLPQE